MMSTLEELLDNEIPTGRQALIDSHNNLPQVASYCEENYEKAINKRAALEETQKYVTQSLASVAYQINTLATSMLNMLDLQATQLANMETNINHIAQTVSIHKEKVARREIGVLTTSKSCPRTHKIVAPSNPEKQQKYKSSAIDYSILDDLGHGTKVSTGPKSAKRSNSVSSGTSTTGSGDFPVNLGRTSSQAGPYGSMSRRRPINAPPTAPVAPGGFVSSRNDSQSSLQSSSQHSPGIPQQERPPSQAQGMGAPPPPSMTGMNQANIPPPPPPPSSTQDEGHSYHSQSVRQASLPWTPAFMRSNLGPGINIGAPPPPPAPPAQQPYDGAPPPSPAPEDLPPSTAQAPFASQLNQAIQQRGGMDLPPPPEDYSQPEVMPPPPPMDDTTMPPPPEFLQTEEPSWVPAEYIEKVTAIFDYDATREDELTFPEGSTIYVLQKNPDGWYEGVMDGFTGLFPGNYVEPCP